MPTLLIVHHTPSPATQELLETVLEATRLTEFSGLEVETRAALVASPVDVLAADGVLLGTPANIGYMSGAMKHFLDQIYYPCLNETKTLPYGLYVHGNSDTSGAVRSVESIAKGLSWRRVGEPVLVRNAPMTEDNAQLAELTQTLAAHALRIV